MTNPDIETSNNRLKKDQDNDSLIDYDYDISGNMTLDTTNQRFIYDAENHIKEFFIGTNNGSTPDATYEYDGGGKRVRKIADKTETIFVFNASGQLVAEFSTEMPTNPKVSYLTADHLGSPRIITDDDKDVVSRHDYLAFGDEVTETVGNVGGRTPAQGYGEDDDIRKQYTGYERDKESGLDFAQARYYNSKQGRFTSVDPMTASANMKDPQTFNRYSYVLNSPYKFTDPLGLIANKVGEDDNIDHKQEALRWNIFWSTVYGSEGEYTKDGQVATGGGTLTQGNTNTETQQATEVSESPPPPTANQEVFALYNALIKEINKNFALGSTLPDGAKITEEINGLRKDLIKVVTEIYRTTKKAIKLRAEGLSSKEFNERKAKVIKFAKDNIRHLAEKYDFPRYMVVSKDGVGENRGFDEKTLQTGLTKYFTRAITAARDDLNQESTQRGNGRFRIFTE